MGSALQDVLYIEDAKQAMDLLKPPRLDMLREMHEPINCTALGQRVGQSPQAAYYHVKAMEHAGLVARVGERRVRGIVEGIYQAAARSYWVSPRLASSRGAEHEVRDQLSRGYLIALAEQVQDDLGRLANNGGGGDRPSLGLEARIVLPKGADRAAFLEDVSAAFRNLAERYGATTMETGPVFKLALACYPSESTLDEPKEN